MKVIHLMMSGSTRSGGLYNSVYGLCQGLKEHIKLQVWFGKEIGRKVEEQKWEIFITKKFLKFPPNKFGYMPGLFLKLLFSKTDILHIHGVWSYNAMASSMVKIIKSNSIKLVVSPRGMLDEWSLNKNSLHKSIALKSYVKCLIHKADLFHALNESEKGTLLKLGVNQNRIMVSANAITELPKNVNNKDTRIFTLTFLGRIHEKKGIENLLYAMKEIKVDLQLLIGGWGDSEYIKSLKILCNKLEIEHKVNFLGPVFDSKKNELFHKSNAFVLPSYSEGLPMAVLEALSYGLPVILTDNCNLTELKDEIFYFPILTNSESIKNTILRVMKLKDSDYNLIANRARYIISSNYSWNSEANKIYNGYKEIISNK